ncbi:MAG: hypothetical protein ICV54_19450 [Nostoc sp. C3-bin3]|nr:hypothetical protein [Nostoc sp. C3-bin3]
MPAFYVSGGVIPCYRTQEILLTSSETQKRSPSGKTPLTSWFQHLRSRCAAALRRIAQFDRRALLRLA